MTLLINLAGLGLIAFIVWWFWIARPEAVKGGQAPVTIRVKDGVYQPSRIEVAEGQSVELRFLREDPGPCAEQVEFSSLNISEQLPLNEEKVIHIPPQAAGEYDFTCQMKMYRGTLVVK